MADAHFYSPVCRFGHVLEKSEGDPITFRQATAVGEYFEGNVLLENNKYLRVDALKKYHENLNSFFNENGMVLDSHEEKNKIIIEFRRTPIVKFPAYYVREKGEKESKWVFREALTTCSGFSRSKVWISLSVKGDGTDTYAIDRIKKICEDFNNVIKKRMSAFIEYYERTISYLVTIGAKEFLLFPKEYSNTLKPVRDFCIKSLQCTYDLSELFGLCHEIDSSYMNEKLLDYPSNVQTLMNEFYGFCFDNSGAEMDDFAFFIQNSIPLERIDSHLMPIGDGSLKDLRRPSLLLTTMESYNNSKREYYFTLGSNDKIKPHRRYRNADFSSRNIMLEVGRVY